MQTQGRKLVDFIPIYISADELEDPEPRSSDSLETQQQQRRFCCSFVERIDWKSVIRFCKKWIRNPMNMAIVVWLAVVGLLLLLFLLLITGLLNQLIPESSERKRWVEIDNQVLNALFTIMCVFQHPRLIHHLILLIRWRKHIDVVGLRKMYCWYPTGRPRERVHFGVVVGLLNFTCLAQYVLCGLYWGFSSSDRSDVGVNLCIGLGTVAPAVAAAHTFFGPLGRKYEFVDSDNDSVGIEELFDRRLAVDPPRWEGGLFDCRNDIRLTCLSFFFPTCVFGWNVERLGLGNMYVHMTTFLLLCTSPCLIFYITTLKIDSNVIDQVVFVTGVLLCFFGLIYGGFWRNKIRKKLRLPGNKFCFGYTTITDYVQWLFCWPCSLAQEVRTGNLYQNLPLLVPLRREGGAFGYGSWRVTEVKKNVGLHTRSKSCPAILGSKIAPAPDDGDLEVENGGGEKSMVVAPSVVVMEMEQK